MKRMMLLLAFFGMLTVAMADWTYGTARSPNAFHLNRRHGANSDVKIKNVKIQLTMNVCAKFFLYLQSGRKSVTDMT